MWPAGCWMRLWTEWGKVRHRLAIQNEDSDKNRIKGRADIMRNERTEITVPGQVDGPAVLTSYILDEVSVAAGKKRPAVIVCPGGGYWRRSDRESEPVIMQFLGMGCHGFLLDYSVAPNHFPTALRELAEAVAILREHSDDWLIDPERIVVCGFSAAGHLACSLGVYWNQEFVYGAIGRTAGEIRPSAMLLGYPVITAGEFAHEGSITKLLGESATEEERRQVSLELHVTADTPKAFIWHTYEDETVPVENSMLLASAMRKMGVNFELHIYPTGAHGSSLANEETAGKDEYAHLNIPCCQSWTGLVKTWLEGI